MMGFEGRSSGRVKTKASVKTLALSFAATDSSSSRRISSEWLGSAAYAGPNRTSGDFDLGTKPGSDPRRDSGGEEYSGLWRLSAVYRWCFGGRGWP
jgi:hypothetical protein